MFIGHFGVGFAAKSVAPKVSLGMLFFAAQFADLLWPTLLLLGIETVRIAPGATAVAPLDFEHYPISHSLLALAGWSVALGIAYRLATRDRRGALVLGLLILSHWILDAIVHRPDLPLAPGVPIMVGLHAWSSPAITVAIELPLFFAGLWAYTKRTMPRNRQGSWALWSLVALLLLIYAGNLVGEPPPSVTAIAWIGQSQWLIVLWGLWIDRNREVRSGP